MNEATRRKHCAGIILFCVLAAAMTARYFSTVSLSFEMISERFPNSMIAASMLNVDMSGRMFGFNILSGDGVVYDGIGKDSIDVKSKDSIAVKGIDKSANGALYLVYHSPEFMDKDVEIAYVREQQVGIQGWATYYLTRAWHWTGGRISPQYWYFLLRAIWASLLAVVITAITFQLRKAYDLLFAVCFYSTCFFSVWLTNFSTNLYWSTFTWFLPMMFSLMSMNYPRLRIAMYILLGVSVAVKTLCGYEYISNIMMCAILFPLTEYLSCPREDLARKKEMFRITFWNGFFAAAGFAAAMLFHAYARGEGSIMQGFSEIYHADALRHTVGLPDGEYTTKASLLVVLARYWLPPSGWGVVSAMVLSTLAVYTSKKHNISVKHDAYLLGLSFWSSLSWFVLAKIHSYIHLHLNHVLWILPFIQTAIYVFIKQRIFTLIPDSDKRQAITVSIPAFIRRIFWLS